MSSVWNIPSEKFEDNDRNLAFEQYKLFVELMDKVSDRRSHANNFFVTLNSTLLTVYGIAAAKESVIAMGPWLWLVPVAGAIICILWRAIVRSYRDINTAKFKIIHEIEERLPLALYKYEWKLAGHGDGTKYRPTSHIEGIVPWVFVALYLIALVAHLIPFLSCHR